MKILKFVVIIAALVSIGVWGLIAIAQRENRINEGFGGRTPETEEVTDDFVRCELENSGLTGSERKDCSIRDD